MVVPIGSDESGHPARGVPILEVSVALGVPMPTLRSWELRHGIPVMARTSGQHRRYWPDEVNALRLMRDEIARGTPAGAAAELVRRLLRGVGPAQELINRILDAAQLLDPVTIRQSLDEAEAALGLPGCLDDVLLPAMRQIGVWWAVGHCDVIQEQLATESVRAWLDRRNSFTRVTFRSRPVLLMCGPRDLHTIGLEATAVLLRDRGWPCRVLGARTSTAVAVAAARATGAGAAVVVSQLASGRSGALATIASLDRLGIPVCYAGNAFAAIRSRRGVPGRYLGTNIAQAVVIIAELLIGDITGPASPPDSVDPSDPTVSPAA